MADSCAGAFYENKRNPSPNRDSHKGNNPFLMKRIKKMPVTLS